MAAHGPQGAAPANDRGRERARNGSKTPKYAALAILLAFFFPPAAVIYATRCWREAGRRDENKSLAYTAIGFVAVLLVVYSLIFAALTRHSPLIVRV